MIASDFCPFRMPTNIELAIAEALCVTSQTTDGTSSLPATPNTAQVISAYIRIAGFTDIQTSPIALSDASVISAFERALEKHASPHSKAGSGAAKLVARVRRDYWTGVLLAAGSQDDELTQLLLGTHQNTTASMAPCSSTACASPNCPSRTGTVPRSKRLTSTSTPTTSTMTFTSSGFESLVGRRQEYGNRSMPERSQIFLKGQGWKTLYPCPCCGSMVRAQEIIRVLDLDITDDDDSASIRTAAVDGAKTGKAKTKTGAVPGAPKKRKAKALASTSTVDDSTNPPRKRKQVKRRTKVQRDSATLAVPPFDPYGPSTSKASM